MPEVAPAFGVRGACSRFRTADLPRPIQKAPASRNALQPLRAVLEPKGCRKSRQRLECVELAPAFPKEESRLKSLNCPPMRSAYDWPITVFKFALEAGDGDRSEIPAVARF